MSDFCPLIKKPCIKHECKWYIQVMGKDANTGQNINDFDCAIAWLPVLLIEGSQQTRQAGAAIESFRNEMVQIQHQINDTIGHTVTGDGGSSKGQIEGHTSETVKQIP